jgi:hypothetical protein
VKPHPGPSFDCEPSQTHSLEGGPDVLLSRPQPLEALHLGGGASGGPASTLAQTNCRSRRIFDAPSRSSSHRQYAVLGLDPAALARPRQREGELTLGELNGQLERESARAAADDQIDLPANL